jgi:hypothetical protein
VHHERNCTTLEIHPGGTIAEMRTLGESRVEGDGRFNDVERHEARAGDETEGGVDDSVVGKAEIRGGLFVNYIAWIELSESVGRADRG